MNIGRSIQYGLMRSGMKSKDLAEKLGITQSQMSKWSNKDVIHVQAIIKIAGGFEVSVSEFIKWGEL